MCNFHLPTSHTVTRQLDVSQTRHINRNVIGCMMNEHEREMGKQNGTTRFIFDLYFNIHNTKKGL